jgi:lipopolysaccharide/colanic/teichoic acid biosynthesis glycosyltransferase
MADRWEESRKRHSGLAKQHKIMYIIIGVLGVVILIVVCILINLAVKINDNGERIASTPPLASPPISKP